MPRRVSSFKAGGGRNGRASIKPTKGRWFGARKADSIPEWEERADLNYKAGVDVGKKNKFPANMYWCLVTALNERGYTAPLVLWTQIHPDITEEMELIQRLAAERKQMMRAARE